MRYLLISGCLLLPLAGCDIDVSEVDSESANAVSFDPRAVADVDTTPPAPPVQENFANIDEALAKLSDDDKRQQMAAYTWLCGQGASAVPKVTAMMNDSSLPMEARRGACRVLGHLGPTATKPLIEASKSSEMALKLKAIETMPSIDPQQKEVVDRLIALLSDDNHQVVNTAIRGLGNIGPAAKRSSNKLLALRDDLKVNETTRQEAGNALKLVRPIRTFGD